MSSIPFTVVAWATTDQNKLGADSGITVTVYGNDRASEVAPIGEVDGWLDTEGADAVLERMGYVRLYPWQPSGGQWAAEVEALQMKTGD